MRTDTEFQDTCNKTITYGKIYAVETAHLSGNLPVCFYDTNSADSLTLYKDDTGVASNKITIGARADDTYPAASAASPNKVSVPTTLSMSDTNPILKPFFILDNNGGSNEASFRLTLLPAPITMTVKLDGGGSDLFSSWYPNVNDGGFEYSLSPNRYLDFTCNNS